MTEVTDLAGAALELAEQGFAIFPVAARAKKPPLTTHGLKDASRDHDTIAAWWTRWPDANIAIATGAASGIYVIDVDEDHGGHHTLTDLEREHGQLPATRAVLTGNGTHHIFRHPELELGNTAGRLGPGLDTRGDGGYIIAPPSWHPDGVRYEWLNELDLAPLPDWIVHALTSPKAERPVSPEKPTSSGECPTPPPMSGATTAYAAKALTERTREVAEAPAGRRNDTLNRAACRMGELIAGGQIDEQFVADELGNAAITAGLARGEISATIASGLRAGKTRPQYPDPKRTRPATNSNSPRPPATPPPPDDRAPAPGPPDPDKGARIEESDYGNALRLIARHGHELRYATHRTGWLRWNGDRWVIDGDGFVSRCAQQTAQAIWSESFDIDDPALAKKRRSWSLKSEMVGRLQGMVHEAATQPGVAITADELDADPWLLNVANGTLDLRSGELKAHDPRDLITKLAPVDYDPDASDPRWDAYLDSALAGDADLASFLQRAVGYTLTGDTSEEVLFFAHGPTETGKSTFLEAIKATLGDYAKNADFETFLQRSDNGGTARPDIARLAGARLVTSSEVDDGKKFAEGLVKTLTGGDTITARYLYRDEFEYRPQFKLWLAANRKPRANHGDGAIWRRIRLVPFVHPPARRDPDLKHYLANDPRARAAILAWAVAGCAAWRTEGLRTPDAVKLATEAYRQEQDPLGEFLEDHAVFEPGAWCRAGELRSAYEKWAHEQGLRSTLSPRAFRELLEERGASSERRRIDGKTTRVWEGLRLLTSTEAPAESPRDRTESKEEPARDARDARDADLKKSPVRQESLGDFSETASHPSRASRGPDEPRTKQCVGCGRTVELAATANPDFDVHCGDCFRRAMNEDQF